MIGQVDNFCITSFQCDISTNELEKSVFSLIYIIKSIYYGAYYYKFKENYL